MTTITNKKANANKEMNVQELLGMTVQVNEKTTALVKFIPKDDRQYIDSDGTAYYVALLNVTFAKDGKNVTTGDKDERKAKNEEIMKNATGFKAVCRDLTAIAKILGEKEKGFLKMTAAVPCPKEVNPNECISNLWLFTSKALREKWLKAVQIGVNDGSYKLATEKTAGKKHSKRIEQIAKAFGITYEEAEAKMQAVK